MSNNRMYFFNVYRDEKLVGSVRAKSSADATALASSFLPTGSYKVKRVTSSQAGVSLEQTSEETEKVTTDFENLHTEENSADSSPVTKPAQSQKKSEFAGQATEKQLQVYSDLKKNLSKWDNAKKDAVRTKFRVDQSGLMFVRTYTETKENTIRRRELIIGKGGGIRAYGTKPRGSLKLMVALKDVINYCFTETPISE